MIRLEPIMSRFISSYLHTRKKHLYLSRQCLCLCHYMETTDVLFDRILQSIGDDGKFQRRFSWIYNFFFVAITSMPYINLLLVMAVPDHWCHVPGRSNTNFTLEKWRNLHSPKHIDSWGKDIYSNCRMHSYNNISSQQKSATDLVDCQYGYDYDDTWYTNTIPSSENWVCDDQVYVATVFATSTSGEVIGAFILGQLGDSIGRRPVYLISIIMAILGKLLILFTTRHFYLFLLACFLSSFPSITALQSTLVISMEITKPEHRAKLSQIQNYGWGLGQIVISLICWAIPEWRMFLIITTLPLGGFILIYRTLIESPRWLAGRDRIDECVKELNKIAKANKKKLDLTLIDKLRERTGEPEAVFGVMSVFSSWRLAKNTIVLTAVLIVYTICYGIFLLNTTKLGGNPFLQFLWQSVIELPGYMLGGYLCDKIGRRFTGSLSYLLTTIMFIPIIVFIKDDTKSNYTNGFILLVKFCISVTYYTQTLQTMEIYPTCLRQTGMSLGIVISGIFGIIVPYIVYWGTVYDITYPYIFMMILVFITSMIQLFLPETLYVKLPETLHEAREFGKNQEFFSITRKSQMHSEKSNEEQIFIERGKS